MKPSLAKTVLIPSGLTPAESATYWAMHKKISVSETSGSETATLIILNEQMENIMKTAYPLKDSSVSKKVLFNWLKNKQINTVVDVLLSY